VTAALMFLIGLCTGVIAGAFLCWVTLAPYLKEDD
jgi:hypothetical protein